MIPIYVGTDERQGIAERVLERSIRDNTSREVEIRWMRAEDPGWTEGWNRRAPKGQYRPKSGGHGTWFSVYRYCVPELMGFQGKAIYLDSDMIVLGDIGELYDLNDGSIPYMASGMNRTEVGVIACDKFPIPDWPTIDEMRSSGWMAKHYRKILQKANALQPGVPPEWNSLDVLNNNTKLLHFTRMPTQPWKPWPEAMSYRPHPDKRSVNLWNEYVAKVEAMGVC